MSDCSTHYAPMYSSLAGVKALQPQIVRDTAKEHYVEVQEKTSKTDEEKLKMSTVH